MSTPHHHPGNPNDTTWHPPTDQEVVNTITIPQENGEIVIKEPGEPAWLRTADWYSLSSCR